MNRVRHQVVALACFLLISARALAQQTQSAATLTPQKDSRWSPQIRTSLTGRVTDKTGGAISGAQVFLIRDGVEIRQITTDQSGQFQFGDIEAGVYDIKIVIQGFAQEIIRSVAAGGGNSASLNLTMDPSGLVGPPPPRFTVDKPVWNVWAEEFGEKAQFKPLPALKTNSDYSLIIDLAALSYFSGPGFYHALTSDTFSEWISKAKGDKATLQLLVIPDRKYFAPQSETEQVREFDVRLDRLRFLKEKGFGISESPFVDLRAGRDDFSFGRTIVRIHTQDVVGNASIAISLWSRGVPLDELTVPFCVTERGDGQCPPIEKAGITLKGVDSLRVSASSKNIPYPDAALQFIELDPANIVGIFRCNTCSDWKANEFSTWQIDRSAHFIAEYLSKTIIHDFEVAGITDDAFRQHGEDLFDLLFHGRDSDKARNRFVQFLNKYPKKMPRDAAPPSLFVRLLPSNEESPLLVPLGLIYVPGYDDFVGLHFRIETPLEQQDYTASSGCIADWVLLVPEDNPNKPADDMQMARKPFADYIGQFQTQKTHAVVHESIKPFRDWLRTTKDPPTMMRY